MKKINRLFAVACLLMSGSVFATTATLNDVHIVSLGVNDGGVTMAVEDTQAVSDAGCYYTNFVVLRNSDPSTPDPYSIEDADHYKMIWAQLNTALSLGRNVKLQVEPIIYGICAVISVTMPEATPAP